MHIWLLQKPGNSGAAACVSSELAASLTLKLVNINAWFAPVSLFKVNIKALLSWQPVWFAALIMSRWRDRHILGFGGSESTNARLGVVDLTGRFGASHTSPAMRVKKINHTTTPSLGVVGGGSAGIVREFRSRCGWQQPQSCFSNTRTIDHKSSPLLATR